MNQRHKLNSVSFFALMLLFLLSGKCQTNYPDSEGKQNLLESLVVNCGMECLQCGQAYDCSECVDKDFTSIQDNKCYCTNPLHNFNEEGYCVSCLVQGCKTCDQSHSWTGDYAVGLSCDVCLDPEATIIDGQCICPPDAYMVDGLCQQQCPYFVVDGKCKQCKLPGCRYCPDPTTCSQCLDPSAWLVEGECSCGLYSGLKLNQNGFCMICSAHACKLCLPGYRISDKCIQCMDPNATIVEGACTCPINQYFDTTGICRLCSDTQIVLGGFCFTHCQNSFGCSSCKNGVCEGCIDAQTILDKNECICAVPQHSFNSEGKCAYCMVAGCKTCSGRDIFACHQCLDPTALTPDNKCACVEGKVMVDGMCEDQCPYSMVDGKCRKCQLEGCYSCSNSTYCEECIDTKYTVAFYRENGYCGCGELDGQALTFNVDGYCTKCNILGCKICQGDAFESQKCWKCLDPEASIVNGKCDCSGWMNKEGMCVSGCSTGYLDHLCLPHCQDTQSCSDCQQQSGMCTRCPQNASIVFNECRCDHEALAVVLQNDLISCNLCWMPGCKICETQLSYQPSKIAYIYRTICYECFDVSASLENGRCVCPEGRVLVDGYCEEDCPSSIVKYGLCQKCEIFGCMLCPTSPSVCLKCHWPIMLEGKCYCPSPLQLNEAGYCGNCQSAHCKVCQADGLHSYRCVECIDPTAEIVDGVCTCPTEGYKFSGEGLCVECSNDKVIPFVLDCMISCQYTSAYSNSMPQIEKSIGSACLTIKIGKKSKSDTSLLDVRAVRVVFVWLLLVMSKYSEISAFVGLVNP